MDLEKLAAAWRDTRDPRVRHLVETIYQPADPPEQLTGRGKKAHARWLAMVEEEPVQLDALLATLTSGNSPQALQRLEALDSHRGDPRLRIALERACVEMPYRTPPGANRFWKRALEMLAGAVEPDWDPGPLADRVLAAHGTSYAVKLAGWIRKIEPPRPGSIRPLDDEELARVEQALVQYPMPKRSKPASLSVPQLLAEIAAHPRDDAPRLVLADLLTEQGNARGEFIALQCARAERESQLLADDPSLFSHYHSDGYQMGDDEVALLEKWRGEWLGPWLSTVGFVVFERGFPVLFSVNRLAKKLGKLVGDPGLATVEHVRIGRNDTPPSLPKFLNHPVLGNLRTLDGVTPWTVEKLSDERAAQLEALTVVVDQYLNIDALAPLLGRMSALQRLRLVGKHAAPAIDPADVASLAVAVLEIDQDDRSGPRYPLRESLNDSVTSFVVYHTTGQDDVSLVVRFRGNQRTDRLDRCELSARQRWVRFDRLVAMIPPDLDIESDPAPTSTTASGEQWAQLGQLSRIASRWEQVEIDGDIDWSRSPDLPVIDRLKLQYQTAPLATLKQLESIDEVAEVLYSYGNFTLRRGDDRRWRSLELARWPSSVTEDTVLPLLDSLAKQLQKASWIGSDDERPVFFEWASRHGLEVETNP